MTILVSDIETTWNRDRVWCIGILDVDTEQYQDYHGNTLPAAIKRLEQADMIVGHNWKGFDHHVLVKLNDANLSKDNVFDTYELSKRICVERTSHKLESWGKTLDYAKGDFREFNRFSQRMLDYLQSDVFLTFGVYHHLVNRMKGI